MRPEAFADDLGTTVGNTGTAHAGLLLADVLDRAGPEQTIAIVVLADGASVFLLGGTQEEVSVAANEIARRLPRLTLAGFHHGHPGRSRAATESGSITARVPSSWASRP